MSALAQSALQVAAIMALAPLALAVMRMVDAKLAHAAIPSIAAPYRELRQNLARNTALRGSWVTRVFLAGAFAIAALVVAALPLAIGEGFFARAVDVIGIAALVVASDVALAIAAFDEDERSSKRRAWSLHRAVAENIPLVIAMTTLVAIAGVSDATAFTSESVSRDLRFLAAPAFVIFVAAVVRMMPLASSSGEGGNSDSPFVGRALAVTQLTRLAIALSLAIFGVRLLIPAPFLDNAAARYPALLTLVGVALGLGVVAGAAYASWRRTRYSLADVNIIATAIAVLGFLLVLGFIIADIV